MKTHVYKNRSLLMLSFMLLSLGAMATPAAENEKEGSAAKGDAVRYQLKLEAFPADMLEVSGQGSYLPGQEVLITVSPRGEASFGSWSMNGTRFSREDTIRFIMPDMDLTLEARTPRESRKHQRKMKRAERRCSE